MPQQIIDILQCWRYGSEKSEIFSNMLVSSVYGVKFENIAPFGGSDGGRDIQSEDGSIYVACYYPTSHKSLYDIKNKFLSDFDKVVANRSVKEFVFVTGQHTSDAQKNELIQLALSRASIKIKIICATDIASHLMNKSNKVLLDQIYPYNDYLEISNFDRATLISLLRDVNLINMVDIYNEDDMAPNWFSGKYINIFSSIKRFNCLLQHTQLSVELKRIYSSWIYGVFEFEAMLVNEFEYSDHHQMFRRIREPNDPILGYLPHNQLEEITSRINGIHQDFLYKTVDLINYAVERHRISAH